MKGEDKLKKNTEDAKKMKESVQEKTEKTLGRINELKQELDEVVKEADKHSKEWVNNKMTVLNSKIDSLTSAMESWVAEQQKKIQEWAQKADSAINAAILKPAQEKIAAITGMEIPLPDPEEENGDESTESNDNTQEDYNSQVDKELLETNKKDYNDTKKFLKDAEKYTYIGSSSASIDKVDQYISTIRDRLYRNQYADIDYRNSDENFVQTLNDILNRLINERNAWEERASIEANMERLFDRAYNDECSLQELMAALETVNNRLDENNYLDSNWRDTDINYKGELEDLIENF